LIPFTIPTYNDGEPVALESEPGVSCLGFALRPTSEGSVAITAADPAAPLLLDPRYLTSDHDRMTTANLMRRARELFERSPIAGRIDHETFPGPQAQSDDDLVDERLRDGPQRRRHRRRATARPRDRRPAHRRLLRHADHGGRNLNGPVMAMAGRATQLIVETANRR
jgi:choline dehydrogenase-like flavoprotein